LAGFLIWVFSPVTVSINFDRPVDDVSFVVTDIDQSGTTRNDQVVFSSNVGNPTLTAVSIDPTIAIVGNTASSIDNQGAGGTGASGNDDFGTVEAAFNDGVTAIQFLYNEIGGVNDPGGRGIGILGDFTMCIPEIVEEGGHGRTESDPA